MIPPSVLTDFLAWIWFLSEQSGYHTLPSGEGVEIEVQEQLGFRRPDDFREKSTFKGHISADARKSFAIGRVVEALTVAIIRDDRVYEVRIGKGGLSAFKVALPMTASSAESVESGVHENMLLLDEVEKIIDDLLLEFLDLRVNHPEELLAQLSTLCVEPEKDDEGAGGGDDGEED